MKKILYLMAVDWYWIKQRPQILAEMLSRDYDVTVVYLREVFQKQMLRNDNDELQSSRAVPALPYRDKNKLAHQIQKLFYRRAAGNFQKYNIIWICHPLLFRYIPKTYQGSVIYDCMDNHQALCADPQLQKTIADAEWDLVKSAERIFVSSAGLMKNIQRLGGGQKAVLVRNGYMAGEIHEPKRPEKKERYRIGYFGTISEWMDFPLLLRSLEAFSNIEYCLWGPVSHVQVPKHPRLRLMGVVEHRDLWNVIKDTDCLIMPFQVNDIVRDVDPVKLYEYISMGKPIITAYYEEIERFAPFVEFYRDEAELENRIERELEHDFYTKYSADQQKNFLEENSWIVRYKNLLQNI